jgi:hypothetical protein
VPVDGVVKRAMERDLGGLLREYMAGGFLAFGFVLLTREVFITYFTWTGAVIEVFGRDLLGLSTILHVAGGFLAGHLVSRRREEDVFRAGATTALFAYIVEFIFDNLFTGAFINGIWIVSGYLMGGVLGAVFSNYKRWKTVFPLRKVKERDEDTEPSGG